MTTAVLIAIGEKPPEVAEATLRALRGSAVDHLIVALDRPTGEYAFAIERVLCDGYVPVPLDKHVMLKLYGPPGWRSPCIAFNAGLQQITADMTIVCHGDVIMDSSLVEVAKANMQEKQAVYLAQVEESKPEMCMTRGHAGPVLMASHNPRAMTYLFAAPTAALKAIGGWDEAFQAGVCFEDDDLMARLWKHGLDFVWDDRMNGIHQSHSRSYFTDIRIAPNMALMLQKHGTLQVYQKEILLGRLKVAKAPGRTEFNHAS